MLIIMERQSTILPLRLLALMLGTLLALQTACKNEQYLIPYEEDLNTHMREEVEVKKANLEVEAPSVAAKEINADFDGDEQFFRTVDPTKSKKVKERKTIADKAPINVIGDVNIKYKWRKSSSLQAKMKSPEVYTLYLTFQIKNAVKKDIDLENIKARYELPQEEKVWSLDLQGSLRVSHENIFEIELGTRTKEDWANWLVSCINKGGIPYHLRFVATSDKALEIAKKLGSENMQAVQDKIDIGITQQRVSGGSKGVMRLEIKNMLLDLGPALLERSDLSQLDNLYPSINFEKPGILKRLVPKKFLKKVRE